MVDWPISREVYDYCIIGGGPSGIYCAQNLSQLGHKVCLLETLETIGGCHRVRYTPNKLNLSRDQELVHTEHGPRVYLGSYLDFWKWIETIGIEKDKHFQIYSFDMVSKDFIHFTTQFKAYEMAMFIIMFFILCVSWPLLGWSTWFDDYTVENFTNDFYFSESGKNRLNRICRLIDGGNTDKTLLKALFDGIDVGMMYNIYEPSEQLDSLLWKKFEKKMVENGVDIYYKTAVVSIEPLQEYQQRRSMEVITNRGRLYSKNVICAIPPHYINMIKNAPELIGFNSDFNTLSSKQQYEPYICSTIAFDKFSPLHAWGIADEHPWGLIVIDMGRYFKSVNGSLFICSITHPEKIDPITKKTGNEMNEDEFLDTIVRLVKDRFKIKDEPIAKALSANVKKENGKWIEHDRAFMYSPPGWLKPNLDISDANNVWSTGHHIGNSHHDYNSMESALQNAIELLNHIEPKYNHTVSKPLKMSTIIHISIIIALITIALYYYLSR